MDVYYFLSERISFILNFYDCASGPFVEIQRKIQAQEHPFVEIYSEDDEPPYLTEWIEADESIQVIGQTCVSMLSAALRLYLHTLIKLLGGDAHKVRRKKGWLVGCKDYFARKFDLDFSASNSDLNLLEEITLARNRVQHPDSIVSMLPTYSKTDLKRNPNAFFVSDFERAMFSDAEEIEPKWIFEPSVHLSKDKLVAAAGEVEKLASWLETATGHYQTSI